VVSLLALGMILSVLPALAQSTTAGSIRGTVTDPAGGIMPGATVVITSDALVSGQQVAIAGGTGVYRFPSLPPGEYAVEAQLSGFQSVRRDGVVLALGQSLDIDLQLGDPEFADEIIVVAEAARVSTVSNTVSHNLGVDFLERQPLPRDATELMNYTPGVNDGLAYGSPSSQGSAYNLDGVDVSDPASGGQWILPNFDWVQEVQVSGLGADAEYGGFTGAMVNLVTKSGGNQVRGDVSAYYSGGDLNSENQPEGAEGVNKLDQDWDVSVSVGGPISRDKLWYFVSGQARERTVEPFYAADAPADDQTNHVRAWSRYLGKLTWQLNDSNKVVGLLDFDGVEHENRGAGEFTLASGSAKQESPNWAYNATWESLVNDHNFASVKLTGFTGTDDRLPYAGSDVPGHDDFFNSELLWGNYTWTWLQDKQRFTVDASWSLFADGLITRSDSHTFKFGVVYEDSSHDERRTRNGGFTYVDDSSPPWCGSLDEYFADPACGLYSSDRGNEIRLDAVQQGLHLYAQDSWKTNRVTVNYGVRYTQYEAGFSGGNESVYDVQMFAPRLGVVWDVLGDASTAIKLHYGRYYDGLFAFMYDREVSGMVFTDLEFWDWNFDTGEWEPAGGRPVGNAVMDPDISHPYVDQFVLSAEHQITDTTLIGLDYVRRENSDIIAMVNVNDDYDQLTAPGNPLTGGDLPFFDLLSGQEFVLTNPQAAYRNYDSVILRMDRRYADGWSLRASLVWTDSTGNTDDVDGYEPAWSDANGQVNNDGTLGAFSEWEFKLNASVDLPWQVMLSGFYVFRSGEHWTPYARFDGLLENDRTNVNLVPRGSEQYDDRSLLDLRLEKSFSFGSDLQLTLMVDVFNVLNSDTVLEVRERWGFYDYVWDAHPDESEWVPSSSYKQAVDVEDAREIRLGARFSF
jgi:hypothetical protein